MLGSILLLLIELTPGFILAQPTGASVTPPVANSVLGASVTFCVDVQGATPFFYQWQKNGVILPAQTNQCLELTNIAIADGGSYRATVSNAGGSIESEEALLTVALNFVPGTDQFVSGTLIQAVSNSVQGASFAASRELDEPRHFNLSTSNSIWYTWRAPTNGIVTFDTRGSTYDTVLAVYTGNAVGALTEIASDDDSGGFHTSQVSWNATAGTEYRVAIDGVTGETGTYVCNWLLERTTDLRPVITLQPKSQTARQGDLIVFRVEATDPRLNLKFQWFHNGQRVTSGGAQSNLTVRNIQPADLGTYHLVVTNVSGRTAISEPAVLEIGPQADVQSRDKVAEFPAQGDGGGGGFSPASASAGTFSLAAGTIINQRFFNSSTSDRCEPAHCGVAGGSSRWFQLAAVADGICTIDTLNSDVDTILAVYVQNFAICTNLYEPLVDCNNDALGTCEQILGGTNSRVRASRLSFFAPAGTTYRAVVDTVGGVRGTNIQFNVRFTAPASIPVKMVQLQGGTATNCLLQMRGSSVTFQVASNVVVPGTTFQWLVNGRRVAGATRDRLMLPYLDFSDVGSYSVQMQQGAVRTTLPAGSLLVLDPCLVGSPTSGVNSVYRLIGATPELIVLEGTGTLTTNSAWQNIGRFQPSPDPTLWDSGTGPRRFYRAMRPPP